MPPSARAPQSIRTRRAFESLSASRARGRSGPLWVVRAARPREEVAGDRSGRGDHADRVEVAYAIGRAVGTAVVRNRLRRRLRAVMRELTDAGLAPGRYLIGAGPASTELTFDALRAHMRRAIEDLP